MPIVKAKTKKQAIKELKLKYGKDILISGTHEMKNEKALEGLKWFGTNWSEVGRRNRVYRR